MIETRVIPVLLLRQGGFYKTTKFAAPVYLGDPINILRIFNEKEVDEICVLDIEASRINKRVDLGFLKDLASECFMPLSYGGGISSVDQMKSIFYLGIEKIVLNTAFVRNPSLITEASKLFGAQSVVVSIDARKSFLGKYVVSSKCGTESVSDDVITLARKAEDLGAGEILLNSIDRDGTMQGYDLKLIKTVTEVLSIPVIACGGASSVQDFRAAVKDAGASAVSAGAMFVFYGPHRAVLINVPSRLEIRRALQ